MSVTPYEQALRDRVEKGMAYRKKHGRNATDEILGPMPLASDYSQESQTEAVEPLPEANKMTLPRRFEHRMSPKQLKRWEETGLSGVWSHDGDDNGRRWVASIYQKNKRILKRFDSPMKAAICRNKWLAKHYSGQDVKACDLERVAKYFGPVLTGN